MSDYIFWQTVGFVGSVIYSSLFEWTLHRYLMHRRWKFFSYPFQAHAITHHHLFKADHTYHLKHEEQEHKVTMAWWNSLVLWGSHVPIILFVQWLAGVPIFWGVMLAMMLYYGTYEYLHYCMHVPRERNVERSGFFFRLNGHHLLHHRYPDRNLNVVLPLADLLFGTLLLRSPVKFAQARGPSIPDVQPLAISSHA